jgi:very long chain acyl-CoA dehydrogenase
MENNHYNSSVNIVFLRCLASAPQVARKGEEVEKASSEAKESQSFTMNLFRGVMEAAQVFPFPQVLNEEQKDTLKMFVDPTAKFFEVCM